MASVLIGEGIGGVLGRGAGVAAGPTSGQISEGAINAMQRQLETAGRGSVEKTIRTLTNRIADHEARMVEYRAAGGNVGSMERELKAFRETIEAAKQVLEKN
jgi:hypothetical protein